jgi:hypothetical protein
MDIREIRLSNHTYREADMLSSRTMGMCPWSWASPCHQITYWPREALGSGMSSTIQLPTIPSALSTGGMPGKTSQTGDVYHWVNGILALSYRGPWCMWHHFCQFSCYDTDTERI